MTNGEAIKAAVFYKERYESKQEVTGFVEKIFRKWIVANAKGPRILDLGCGDGTITAVLTDKYEVVGVDISESNLDQARKLGLRTLKHDLGKKLPFGDGEFDTVVSSQVLEHLYDTDFYLEEAFRVLKKGGVLLLTTPNAVSLTDRVRVMLGKLPITCEVSMRYKLGSKDLPNGHIRPYTFPELRFQLTRTGFKVVDERTTNFPFPIYWSVPNVLKETAVRLGRLKPSFGGQIMVKAVK